MYGEVPVVKRLHAIAYLLFRLILYFPVSALVTLFANILQNPQDARARADVKLMNLVVNFLSMLVSDEENGSVKRMLGVCSEFERIARVVLDKSDKDSHSRRKRKTVPEDKATPQSSVILNQSTSSRSPHTQAGAVPDSSFSPSFNGGLLPQSFIPSLNGFGSPPNGLSNGGPNGDMPAMQEFGNDFSDMLSNSNGLAPGFSDGQSFPTSGASPLNLGSFQQPFVPQDLWQMPMTLEWDWADMTQGGYSSFDQLDGQQQSLPQ